MLRLAELAALVQTQDVEVRDVLTPLEPWLAQTDTPGDAAAQIRAALRAELDGGPATDFRPSERDGELRFVHVMASLIG